jgi:hypothetical protein
VRGDRSEGESRGKGLRGEEIGWLVPTSIALDGFETRATSREERKGEGKVKEKKFLFLFARRSLRDEMRICSTPPWLVREVGPRQVFGYTEKILIRMRTGDNVIG